MNKFLLNCLKFTGYSILIYVFLIFIWGRFIPNGYKPNLNYRMGSYGHMHTRIQEAKSAENVDVLFLGSSHAYRGFDPRIFAEANLSSFNLGSSSQTPLQTKILLNRYLERFNPKTVIYEVYPTTFSIDGVESTLDIIANDNIDQEIVKLAFKHNNLKVYNTLIYGTIAQGLGLDDDFVEPIKRYADTYVGNGYVAREKGYFKTMQYDPQAWSFDQNQLDAFKDIVKILEEKQIDLHLVYAPITSALYQSYTNGDLVEKTMNSYGQFYDFNQMLDLNDSLHFYDSNHLNQEGVELFNQAVIQAIFKRKMKSSVE